jgi:AcrR family transcriptional regulator
MARRIGASDSQTRLLLVEAAEQLMLEEGYAAVTSRHVGRKAEISSQLVHYYFRTMDDLFLEIFRRRSEQGLAQFAEAVASDRSLRTLWRFRTDTHGAVFNTEFVALANHRKAIRSELASYAERFRTLQLDLITQILTERGLSTDEHPPAAVLLTIMGVSQIIAVEESFGVTTGHDVAIASIERWLDELDRDPRAVPVVSSAARGRGAPAGRRRGGSDRAPS